MIVGISGGSCSGKTTVCEKLKYNLEKVGVTVTLICQDNFYNNVGVGIGVDIENYNFDHPEAIDLDLLYDRVFALKNNNEVELPQYSFIEHKRLAETVTVKPAQVIIVEGILIFNHKELFDCFDLKVFVRADADTMLSRRLIRDEEERGRNARSILEQYNKFVRGSYKKYVAPWEQEVDLIIPNDKSNNRFIGTQILTNYILNIVQMDK